MTDGILAWTRHGAMWTGCYRTFVYRAWRDGNGWYMQALGAGWLSAKTRTLKHAQQLAELQARQVLNQKPEVR